MLRLLNNLIVRRSIENPKTPLSAPDDWLVDLFGAKSSSGVKVTRETALTYSPVWRAVNLISSDVARLPLHVLRRLPEGGKERAVTHPAYRLVRRKPSASTTAYYFKKTMQAHVLLTGNAYAFIARKGDGTPDEWILMSPEVTFPVRKDGVLWYVTTVSGSQRKLDPSNVFHLKGLGFDGLVGYSPIAKAREAIGLGLATQKYGAIFFKNNARQSVTLEHPGHLGDKAKENLLKGWNAMHQGLDNAHKVAVLEEGMKATPMSIVAKDAQLIESKQMSIIDVANYYGVPPHKLGDRTRTSFKSLEQENQSYLDDLDHWLVNWEEEAGDKLLTEDQKRNDTHLIEFLRQALVRVDLKTRFGAYNTALQAGWMSRDEIRDLENLNPIPDGEGKKFLVALNMGEVGQDETDTDDDTEEDVDTNARLAKAANHTWGRILKRLRIQSLRAAKKPAGFIAFVESLQDRNADVIESMLEPFYQRGAGQVAGMYLDAMSDKLLRAAECKIAELESSVDAALDEKSHRSLIKDVDKWKDDL